MPTSTNVPSNPDGYSGDCSVTNDSGIPTLVTNGQTIYMHFGVPYGKIKFSVNAKGNGIIRIKPVKNSDEQSSLGSISSIATISINSLEFEKHDEEYRDWETDRKSVV